MKRLLLPLAIVLAGCMDPMAMLTDAEINSTGTFPVTVTPPILQYKPYPIHVEWWECDYGHHPVGCENEAYRVNPDDLDQVFVAATLDAVDEWARVLAPTPAEPYVVPVGSGGGSIEWTCHGFERYVSGDTLRAGLTLHVVHRIGADGVGLGGCGWGHGGWIWASGEDAKPPSAFLMYGAEWVKNIREWNDPLENYYRVALHEIGHVVISDRWLHSTEWSADSTMTWIVDSSAVATFNRFGGESYPGKKVPANVVHWIGCTVPDDIMSEAVWSDHTRITDITLSMLWRGFEAVPQGARTDPDAWKDCPELRAGGSSADHAPRVILTRGPRPRIMEWFPLR